MGSHEVQQLYPQRSSTQCTQFTNKRSVRIQRARYLVWAWLFPNLLVVVGQLKHVVVQVEAQTRWAGTTWPEKARAEPCV